MDAWLDSVLNWIASNFMLNVTQCSIVRYFLDLPYNTLASPVSKEYKNVLQRTLVAVWEIDPLTCCSSNAAHMRAVLSYERWQFSDFQGARTSWGTQNDLWKSRLLLPASQDINRYPIYPQVLGWMIRTPWNSYFVTKCHKCFVANPLVIVDPSMRASDFEMVPFLVHRAPLPHSIEELNLCSQAVSELHLLAGDTIFNTTSKVQGMYMLAAGDLSLC